ncbi:MAG: PspA-associated protein PspAA [Propioniciclava sp.]
MIVRILGEGQFVLDDGALEELNALDDAVEAAAGTGDPAQLNRALAALLAVVRDRGEPVDVDLLIDSDVILPDAEATLEQIIEWIGRNDGQDGLVPENA